MFCASGSVVYSLCIPHAIVVLSSSFVLPLSPAPSQDKSQSVLVSFSLFFLFLVLYFQSLLFTLWAISHLQSCTLTFGAVALSLCLSLSCLSLCEVSTHNLRQCPRMNNTADEINQKQKPKNGFRTVGREREGEDRLQWEQK